ncbi:calcineurin b [Anaeramoeba flamelloides]|uniref:Calcineurin b n=1 Tax=Anaeramoeba flamelloides TaxID=1746091 RepID=A0AAV8A2U3_9EUKA|nr:calcineurin b [Anaeramoeba flamelloides]
MGCCCPKSKKESKSYHEKLIDDSNDQEEFKPKNTEKESKKYGEKLTEEEIEKLTKETHFSKEEILNLYEYYKNISSSILDDDIIDNEEFEEALGLTGSAFAKRLFEVWNFRFYLISNLEIEGVIDIDNNGEVDFDEFCLGLKPFTSKGTIEDRIQFSFQVYDLDGNGQIDKKELFTLLKSCLSDQFRVNLSDEDLRKMVKVTFEEVDTDESGEIDFEEYMIYARKNPKIMDNLKIDLPFLKKKEDDDDEDEDEDEEEEEKEKEKEEEEEEKEEEEEEED